MLFTSTGLMYEGRAKTVVLPGEDGEFSVMDNHQPFIYALKRGIMRIVGPYAVSKTASNSFRNSRGDEVIKIRRGLASMKNNRLLVLMEN